MSNRIMTTDTRKPEMTMDAANAAPNQPSARWTLTRCKRTKADWAMYSPIHAVKAAP